MLKITNIEKYEQLVNSDLETEHPLWSKFAKGIPELYELADYLVRDGKVSREEMLAFLDAPEGKTERKQEIKKLLTRPVIIQSAPP